MGHDLWPRDNCVTLLQRLRKAFSEARCFLLGDTTCILMDNPRSKYAVIDDKVPNFTLGFEAGHTMKGVYLPTVEGCQGIFAEGGW